MIHASHNPKDWTVKFPHRQPRDWEGTRIVVPKNKVSFWDRLSDAFRALEGK